VLRIPICEQPKGDQMFDDSSYWELAEEGFPSAGGVEQKVEYTTEKNDVTAPKVEEKGNAQETVEV